MKTQDATLSIPAYMPRIISLLTMPNPTPPGQPPQFPASAGLLPPEAPPRTFLDVPVLLELSEPVGRISRFWFLAGGVLLIRGMTVAASSAEPHVREAIHVVGAG